MTHDLKTSLEAFTEAEYAAAPASTIDIGRARADGRRKASAHRLAAIGGGVAVVAACALVVNALGGTSPAAGKNVGAGTGQQHFTGTDPLTAIGKFGWLPPGFQTSMYAGGVNHGNGVTARTKPAAQTGVPVTPPGLILTSSRVEPTHPDYYKKTETTVKGSSKAYILHNPGDAPDIPDELSLEWQTASGSWFTLGGDYEIHGAELEALLTKVAESVVTHSTAVPLPIHVEGLPKGVNLGDGLLQDPAVVGEDGFQLTLGYQIAPNQGSFSVSAMPIGWQAVPPNGISKTQQAGGQSTTPVDDATHACKDSDGLRICVVNYGENGVDSLASVGGAKGLLDRITSLGTDRANWTTNVVN